jgi:hypothetical protein
MYLSFFNQTQQLTNQLSALALQFSTNLSVKPMEKQYQNSERIKAE